MHKNENLRFLIASMANRVNDVVSRLPKLEMKRINAALDELRQLETQLQRITLPHIKPEDLQHKDLPIPDGWRDLGRRVATGEDYWLDPITELIVCGPEAPPVCDVDVMEPPPHQVTIVEPDVVNVAEELSEQIGTLIETYSLPVFAKELAWHLDSIDGDMQASFESPRFASLCGELAGHVANFVSACETLERSKEPAKSHWHNDPHFPHKDWVAEVMNDETRLSYADWVEHQRDNTPAPE
jgi:hypothetical protein